MNEVVGGLCSAKGICRLVGNRDICFHDLDVVSPLSVCQLFCITDYAPDISTCFKESWNQPSSHVAGRTGDDDETRRCHSCFFWATHLLLLIVWIQRSSSEVTRSRPPWRLANTPSNPNSSGLILCTASPPARSGISGRTDLTASTHT